MQIPRLREYREARALTQEELAESAGISARSVAGYEAGSGARPGTVRALAAALEVEVPELTRPKEGAPPSPQPTFNHVIAQEERRIAEQTLAGWQEYLNHFLDWTEKLRNKFAFDLLGTYSPEEKVVQVRLVFQETYDFLYATSRLSTLDRNLFSSLSEDPALTESERGHVQSIRQTIALLRFRGQRLDQHVEKIRARARDLKWLQEQVDALEGELAQEEQQIGAGR